MPKKRPLVFAPLTFTSLNVTGTSQSVEKVAAPESGSYAGLLAESLASTG
jgi:hypothetical protein